MSKASRRITGTCHTTLPRASLKFQSPFGPRTNKTRKIKPQVAK